MQGSMGILQARILEWVAMPSSRESSQPRDQYFGHSLEKTLMLGKIEGGEEKGMTEDEMVGHRGCCLPPHLGL